ncbi:MAG: hypothetical protein R2849_15340 [Thermomicrobiales bacterium]
MSFSSSASSGIEAQLGSMMGDAPMCDVRPSASQQVPRYKCLNCGNSLGCS